MLQFVVIDLNTGLRAPTGMDVEVFPSPTNSSITWQSPFAVQHMRIMDLQGRMVIQNGIDGSENGVIDLSDLPSGLYSIELIGDRQRAIGRVVKE